MANTELTRLQQRMTVAYFTEYEPESAPQRLGRGWIGWSLLALLGVAVLVGAFVPSDYVIERPGPVFDTLGTVEIEGDTVPLIDIPAVETYPTTGSLDMLTVTTVGNREYRNGWGSVLIAMLDPSQDVIPLDEIFPDGQTADQSAEISAAQMSASQQAAIAAALTALGEDYVTTVSIGAVGEGSPADGLLLEGDVITAVDGHPVLDGDSLKQLIADNGTEGAATITVLREGVATDVSVTPVLSDTEVPVPVVGIGIIPAYTFPFDVSIQLSDVGGPSAGQIFALAIIDKLTPGSLNGGQAIAGTGTITPAGDVGAIGGITQKMYAAQRAGADYFLAPASNCADVIGNIPDGLTVFSVATLGDSLTVLNTLSTGGSTSFLPRCTVQ